MKLKYFIFGFAGFVLAIPFLLGIYMYVLRTSVYDSTLLSAPGYAIASEERVALILGDRECDSQYVIERSSDGKDWNQVGVMLYSTYQGPRDPELKSCENSFVDADIPVGVSTLYYRYQKMGVKGKSFKVVRLGK